MSDYNNILSSVGLNSYLEKGFFVQKAIILTGDRLSGRFSLNFKSDQLLTVMKFSGEKRVVLHQVWVN